MPGQGMNEIASELLLRSRDGKIAWKQTIKDHQFRVSFPDVSLSISHYPSLGSYQLDLINETGSTIETLDGDPFYSPAQGQDDKISRQEILKEIYELAEAYVQDVVTQRALQYLKQAR